MGGIGGHQGCRAEHKVAEAATCRVVDMQGRAQRTTKQGGEGSRVQGGRDSGVEGQQRAE